MYNISDRFTSTFGVDLTDIQHHGSGVGNITNATIIRYRGRTRLKITYSTDVQHYRWFEYLSRRNAILRIV